MEGYEFNIVKTKKGIYNASYFLSLYVQFGFVSCQVHELFRRLGMLAYDMWLIPINTDGLLE